MRNSHAATGMETQDGGNRASATHDDEYISSDDDDLLEASAEGAVRKSDCVSLYAEDSDEEDMGGGTASQNDVIRQLRNPPSNSRRVFELAPESADKRYYSAIASRLNRSVIPNDMEEGWGFPKESMRSSKCSRIGRR